MSRWVNLNQALAKASSNWSGFSRKRLEISRYLGSVFNDRSVVNIIGAWNLPLTWASGTVVAAAPSLGTHWIAPAGLRVCSHSKLNRFCKYIMVHWVGAEVQAPSRPLPTVSSALPLPHLFFHPKPCSSSPAAAGSAPTQS